VLGEGNIEGASQAGALNNYNLETDPNTASPVAGAVMLAPPIPILICIRPLPIVAINVEAVFGLVIIFLFSLSLIVEVICTSEMCLKDESFAATGRRLRSRSWADPWRRLSQQALSFAPSRPLMCLSYRQRPRLLSYQ
jgi:hypothetical protein